MRCGEEVENFCVFPELSICTHVQVRGGLRGRSNAPCIVCAIFFVAESSFESDRTSVVGPVTYALLYVADILVVTLVEFPYAVIL